MPRKPGGDQVYELLRAALVAVGDVEIHNRFASDIQVGLKERKMPVLELGHDEDLVRPVKELLSDLLHGKRVRAGGSRFIVF